MNKWHIYDLLKSMKPPNAQTIIEIEKMEPREVKEGLLEWLTVLNKDKYYQDQLRLITGQMKIEEGGQL